MYGLEIVVVCCLVGACAGGFAGPEITYGGFSHLTSFGTTSVECVFPDALNDCQVRIFSAGDFDTILEFGWGSESPIRVVKESTGRLTRMLARYGGSGLADGQCGARVSEVQSGTYLVQCLGRSDKGGWARGFSIIYATRHALLNTAKSDPALAVVRPGDSVSVLMKTFEPLDYCTLQTPEGKSFDVQPGQSLPAEGRFRLHGAGLENKECGFTIANVTAADAGIWTWIGMKGNPNAWQMKAVVVAAGPVGDPTLVVGDAARLRVGETLVATCVAPASIPAVNLTWLLGGTVLRQDSWNDTLDGEEAWTLPWMPQTVRQTLSRQLTAQDDGKRLECRIEHLAMTASRSSSTVLRVQNASFRGPRPTAVTLECGKVGVARPLIAGGRVAEQGQFPWHAAIYKRKGGAFEQQCGGSLVSARVVVSAAHCFYDESLLELRDLSLYRIALGKTQRAWGADIDNAAVQRFQVASVTLTEFYSGSGGNFLHDIAVVRLSRNALVTSTVDLVCVDWSHALDQLPTGTNGTVAGWGATERRFSTDVLHWTDLEFVALPKCREHLRRFRKVKLLTPDKMCAGFVNQTTSVCPGDSGGGLVRLDATSQRHFLVGVVSISFETTQGTASTCRAELFTGFTRVSDHADWLRGLL